MTHSQTSSAISAQLDGASRDALLYYDGRWRPRAWLRRGVASIGQALEHCTRVGIVARNRPQIVAALAANLVAQRSTVMIYSAQSPSGIAADIGALGLDALIADAGDWGDETLTAARQSGILGLSVSDGELAPTVTKVVTREKPTPTYPSPSDEIAIELLTSGTTGAPKRFPLAWEALDRLVADAQGTYLGTKNSNTPQVMIHPLGNISGVVYLVPPLVYGQPVALLDKFEPSAWAEAVRTHKPRRGTLPPAAVRMLLDARVPRSDLASLDLIAVGGGNLDPELQDRFEQIYGIPILTAFGATEFGGVIAGWSLDDYRRWGKAKRGSVGRALANARLRITDPATGTPLPSGEVGALEALVPRIGEDWIRTNDLASLDDDGFLFHHGRADAAINRGGFKVVPETVAQAIGEYPGVSDAVVVGIPDDRLGEIPAAAVLPEEGATVSAEELADWLRKRLLAYQVPAQIIMVKRFPRNESMKISMNEVKALFE